MRKYWFRCLSLERTSYCNSDVMYRKDGERKDKCNTVFQQDICRSVTTLLNIHLPGRWIGRLYPAPPLDLLGQRSDSPRLLPLGLREGHCVGTTAAPRHSTTWRISFERLLARLGARSFRAFGKKWTIVLTCAEHTLCAHWTLVRAVKKTVVFATINSAL